MNTVRIPTQLRGLTEGAPEVHAEGRTVAELVADLEGRYPGLRARLVDDAGSLRRFVNLYVDDENVRFLDGLQTPLTGTSTVSIIPAVAGG